VYSIYRHRRGGRDSRKNYDCFIDGGMIFTNRRNMMKKSLVMPPEKEFSWISQYGSVTFSQDQEKADILQDKLSVNEYEDPFKG
jgi:hypothetical protein